MPRCLCTLASDLTLDKIGVSKVNKEKKRGKKVGCVADKITVAEEGKYEIDSIKSTQKV